MRCIEISKPGGPDVLCLTERPDPFPGPGEVLLDVAAAGINRPDCLQRQGLYPPPPGASDIPGLEVAGTIIALGEGVTGWSVGDQACALVTGGGYAEKAVAPVQTLLPIPKGVSLLEAASLPETVFTVWSTLFMRGGLEKGEDVLIHGGSSGIGTTAIQLAKAFGARAATTAGSEEKCAYCKGLGADLTINYREKDFETRIKQAWGSVDVVLDMVGGDYIPKNINLLKPDGRHISIAFLNGPKAEINFAAVMLKRLTLTGATLRARDLDFKAQVAEAVQTHVWPLLEQGGIKPIIHADFALSEAAQAHALMESSSHMGKIMLNMSKKA